MPEKIRAGIVGLNVGRGWGAWAHLPAIRALPEFELVAACTSRKETAAEAARHFGIPLAFGDAGEMARHPDVDLVIVCVRVPEHDALVRAALDAGKHVYCEWPLAATTDRAISLREQANARGVCHMVGFQGRGAPAIRYAKDLVANGYVGRVLSATMLASISALGGTIDGASAYTVDPANGATTLTIPGGHSLDAFCYCVGDFQELSATLATQFTRATVLDTGDTIEKTAADQVAVLGVLEGGAVASVHIQGGTFKATGFWLEINGSEGDLVVSGPGGVQVGPLTLRGARRGDGAAAAHSDIAIPASYDLIGGTLPAGPPPFNVAQQLRRLGRSIQEGTLCDPDFNTGVQRHRLLDDIRESAARRIHIRCGAAQTV